MLLDVVRGEGGMSVRELVARVSRGSGMPEFRVARCLYSLRVEGRVSLEDSHPPAGFMGYLGSYYGAWLWAALALIALTAGSVYLLPQGAPFIYLRYIFGSVFVLYLPGYALIEALYPRRGELDGLERLALSVGLSLALVPLVGLVLNYTPWGIRLDPILVSLSLVAGALVFAAAFRKVGYMRLSRAGGRA
jgi:hypothetical protein